MTDRIQFLQAIQTWIDVLEREGSPLDPSRFLTDAQHSLRGGLLEYLMKGNEPHEHPPPLYYSRPWHQLIDDGGYEGPLEVWRLHEKWGSDCDAPDEVIIGQHGWQLLEILGESKYRIQWTGRPKLDEDGEIVGWTGLRDEKPRLGIWQIEKIREVKHFTVWRLQPE